MNLNERINRLKGLLEKPEHMCADDPADIVLCCEVDPDYEPYDCAVIERGGSWDTCEHKYVLGSHNFLIDDTATLEALIELINTGSINITTGLRDDTYSLRYEGSQSFFNMYGIREIIWTAWCEWRDSQDD